MFHENREATDGNWAAVSLKVSEAVCVRSEVLILKSDLHQGLLEGRSQLEAQLGVLVSKKDVA